MYILSNKKACRSGFILQSGLRHICKMETRLVITNLTKISWISKDFHLPLQWYDSEIYILIIFARLEFESFCWLHDNARWHEC